MSSVSFSICCLIFMIIICCVYFFKKRIISLETNIYSLLIVTTIVALVIDIFGYFYLNFCSVEDFISIFIVKVNVIFYFVWNWNLTAYISSITHLSFSPKKEKIFKLLSYIYWIILLIMVLVLSFLKIDIVIENGAITNSFGPAVSLVYIYTALSYIYMIISLLIYNKKVSKKKIIPLFVFFIFGGIVVLIQKFNPQLTLSLSVEAIVTVLMYFTIENPDLKMLNQMELAKDSAERANMAKTEFLSSMSHEIRTPLNAIVGFSECITKADSLDSAKEDAKDIITASQNLLEIVNGILDISKIEAGKMELVETDYDLEKIGEDLTKLMIARIGEKPIKFTQNFAVDIPGVLHGDGAKVKQIMTNLLTNAVKYTETGEIKYNISCINNNNYSKIIISVEDTGRGIKPEKIDSLFNKFERLEEDRNTTTEGTGLGLAITKKLVEMMDGKITVQSKYGEGSVFTVYIVQRIVSLHKEQPVETLDYYTNFASKKVLVVDDNKLNIKIAGRLLSEYKIKIDEADSGAKCIEMINNGENFDLILMDDMMPNMSGTETMKKLKEMGIKTPIVVLTANAIEGMKEKYIEDGFNYYLSKPIEKKELEKVLNNYLAGNIPKISPLGPIPESVYKITEQDVKEIDELMPKSELEELERKEENNSLNNNVVKEEVIPVENKESNNLEEIKDVSEVLEVIDDSSDTSADKLKLVEDSSNNKGNKDYLINNGIDLKAALDLLGDMDMYNETLQGFLTETERRVPEMLEYKNSGNMKDYAIHAHAMKSDSKYLGFTKLAELSLNHELKAKDNDSEYVNSHYDELMNELTRILNIIKQYL